MQSAAGDEYAVVDAVDIKEVAGQQVGIALNPFAVNDRIGPVDAVGVPPAQGAGRAIAACVAGAPGLRQAGQYRGPVYAGVDVCVDNGGIFHRTILVPPFKLKSDGE